jgi:hypothetical protein
MLSTDHKRYAEELGIYVEQAFSETPFVVLGLHEQEEEPSARRLSARRSPEIRSSIYLSFLGSRQGRKV